MKAKQDIDVLKKAPILSDLDPQLAAELLAGGKFVRRKTGEAIMHEGEEADTMYLFLEGEVDVSKNLTLKIEGKGFGQAEKSMTRLKAGTASVFGEMSMFGTEPRSATVTARSDCLLFELSKESFDELCRNNPVLGLFLTKRIAGILSARLRKGNEDVLKLSTALSIALSR